MAQETQEIDLRMWIIRILKNWYWILLSCIVFGALGVYKFFSTTYRHTVDAKIMIRTSDSESGLPQMDMLALMGMGGMKQIEDEVAILTSRDILTQVVRDLDLQSEYRKKRKLKWEGQYPSHDLTVVYPETFLDTIRRTVRIEVRARKNDYLVKVRYGHRWEVSRHKVQDLALPIQSRAGEIVFTSTKPLEKGDAYRIVTHPMLPAVDKYTQTIIAAPLKKESNVIVISTSTDMPKRAIDFINKEIDYYNLDAVVDITGCVGTCYLEPIVDVYDDNGEMTRYVKVQPDKVAEIVEKHLIGKTPVEELAISDEDKNFLDQQQRVVLRNCGNINPEKIDEYIAVGGYEGLKKVVTSMTQDEVIQVIKDAGLRGRGGAGFPTWFKWNAAKQSPGTEKYMVCNADEGDPGAFMDRSVLEGDPHSLIEGMAIGGFAMGAIEGIVYVRAEYPLAIERLEIAMEQARERGFLGKNLFGTNFSFDMRIKAGAGAFVCGEETALIASLEGERGMPRLKPPFPAQKGYWQKPTNINNVETFANVPWILTNGGEAFAAMGSEKSNGTKVFALAGKIKKGGLVEVPMGMTIREVIFGIGGGIKNDKKFKAVQLGGPSGGCVPEYLADTPVTYEDIATTGAIVGSGGMIVMDETTCMVDMARFFLDFTKKESCGKCNYCRIGTKRMLEILERITKGEGRDGDIELLEELADKIKNGAMCGLGQTAPNPVLTTLKYFRNEYEDHIYNKKCTAGACKALIHYEITDKCVGCTKCARNCPVGAITGSVKQKHVIDTAKCIKCGKCEENCNFGAIVRE